jgi:hypothetical protein
VAHLSWKASRLSVLVDTRFVDAIANRLVLAIGIADLDGLVRMRIPTLVLIIAICLYIARQSARSASLDQERFRQPRTPW